MEMTRNKRPDYFTIINTNARSLCPKLSSFVDCFKEMESHIAVVTETWLKEGKDLEDMRDDLLHGSGAGLLTLCRPPNSAGVSHGGIAVAFREAMVSMKAIALPNPENYEVLPTVATLESHSRRVVTIAAYISPGYRVARGRGCLHYIADVVMEVKRRYREPTILIAGDFNQWDISGHLEDFSEISEAEVGSTRSGASIDRIFTNVGNNLKSCGTVPPLDADDSLTGTDSDHRVAYARLDLKKTQTFEWLSYSYVHYDEESEQEFGRWLAGHDWSEVMLAEGSNLKTEIYQRTVTAAINSIFPVKFTRRKSTDLPWINSYIKRQIRRRRAIFKLHGRSDRWHRQKKRTDELIRIRRDKYFAHQKKIILANDANRVFYKNVRRFKSSDKPPRF